MAEFEQAVKENNLFGLGNLNTAYAQYFTGASYLQGLVQAQNEVDVMLPTLTLSLVVVITGTFTMMAFRFC